ncbi:unnamed protein product [Prunus armeniaca]|uniref:Uncharacterized protein n=1 Tax=Prunus armeniaca TaxID=36596 RepID=A0A6J5WW88_PRUAR|nr:unnamed protein product [Prunus armeniaca]
MSLTDLDISTRNSLLHYISVPHSLLTNSMIFCSGGTTLQKDFISLLVSIDVYCASTDPQTHFNIERGPPTTPISTMDIEGKGRGLNAEIDVEEDSQTEITLEPSLGLQSQCDRSCLPFIDNRSPTSRTSTQTHYQFELFANNVTNPVTHLLCGSINQL